MLQGAHVLLHGKCCGGDRCLCRGKRQINADDAAAAAAAAEAPDRASAVQSGPDGGDNILGAAKWPWQAPAARRRKRVARDTSLMLYRAPYCLARGAAASAFA